MPEAELEAAARMRALARIHPGLVHDLRSPLNALVLNFELLKSSFPQGAGEDPEARLRRQWLEVLERELARLRQGLDRLLDELGPVDPQSETFDLRRVMYEVVDLTAPQTRQDGVELAVDDAGGPVWIQACRDRVKRALLLLVVKALEAAGGDRIGLKLTGDGGTACLAIRFPGTPPDARDGGSELAAARRAIERESGELASTGSAGGTTLTVHFPLTEDPL